MSESIQIEEDKPLKLRRRQKEEKEEEEEESESKKLIREVKEEIKSESSIFKTLFRWIFSTTSFPGQEYFAPYSSLVNMIVEIQDYLYLRKLEKCSIERMRILEHRIKPSLRCSRKRLHEELTLYEHMFKAGKTYFDNGNSSMANQIRRDLSQKKVMIESYQTQIRLLNQIISQAFLAENAEMLLSGIIQFAKISTTGNQVGVFERNERKLLNKFNETSDLIQVFDRFTETTIEEGRAHRLLTAEESFKDSSQEMEEESEQILIDFYSSSK